MEKDKRTQELEQLLNDAIWCMSGAIGQQGEWKRIVDEGTKLLQQVVKPQKKS